MCQFMPHNGSNGSIVQRPEINKITATSYCPEDRRRSVAQQQKLNLSLSVCTDTGMNFDFRGCMWIVPNW